MSNIVTISGMFGAGKTYFAGSPVVIDISGLYWGETVTSPFTVVRIVVVYNGRVFGEFHADTGGQTSTSFDISSALRAIWADYDFDAANGEIAKAQAATTAVAGQAAARNMRPYTLRVYTEYIASDDGGVYTVTQCSAVINNVEYTDIPGGQCVLGSMTEWERSLINDDTKRDVSAFEHTGIRNGDASTKPVETPERVGSTSITSWCDVQEGLTKTIFYPYGVGPETDDVAGLEQGWTGHAPIVLRDSIPYADFLFLNRRGAIETCSGMTKEAMSISTAVQQYSRSNRPSFKPSRSLMAIGSDGRRSWQMSSGYVTREWAEWWAMEFLGGKHKRWWMLWQGPGQAAPRYVPVIVKPAKSDTGIYDRSKQQMPHVDFTVTLALEG